MVAFEKSLHLILLIVLLYNVFPGSKRFIFVAIHQEQILCWKWMKL